jgi:trans-aconitate 2-methyltransferase
LSEYTFGDSNLARDRLAIVAETFESPTRALLDDLPTTFVRYILDLGCGPGHTTMLLRATFPLAQITGFDSSEAMLAEARSRVADATFAVFDVTHPLLLPADIVFSRCLLGHLPNPGTVLSTWATSLRPGNGLLVCEEPVRYRTPDPWFARYEEAVTGVVASTGATLWAAPALDDDPASCDRVVDRVVEHPVTKACAAGMFWRNAAQWRDRVEGGDALVDHFRSLERSDDDEIVTWELRQVVFRKRRA